VSNSCVLGTDPLGRVGAERVVDPASSAPEVLPSGWSFGSSRRRGPHRALRLRRACPQPAARTSTSCLLRSLALTDATNNTRPLVRTGGSGSIEDGVVRSAQSSYDISARLFALRVVGLRVLPVESRGRCIFECRDSGAPPRAPIDAEQLVRRGITCRARPQWASAVAAPAVPFVDLASSQPSPEKESALQPCSARPGPRRRVRRFLCCGPSVRAIDRAGGCGGNRETAARREVCLRLLDGRSRCRRILRGEASGTVLSACSSCSWRANRRLSAGSPNGNPR